ncbi:MAG: hypothetical protein RL479_2599 [Verrucomicrobiota bacterium]
MVKFALPLLAAATVLTGAPVPSPRDLAALFAANAERLGPVLRDPAAHRVQVLLAEPVRLPDGTFGVRRSAFGDPAKYFYPASTVKLSAAVAALLELNARNARDGTAWGLA